MTAGIIVRWIIGGMGLLFGTFVAACNWYYIYSNIQNKRKGIDRNFSQGPFIGPLAVLFGIWFIPGSVPKIWILLLIDPSTWIMVVAIPMLLLEEKRKK